MPRNDTDTNSGKISLQETIIKILVFTLTASRLNSKVYHFSLGLSRIILASHSTGHTKNLKLNGYNMKSRL